MDFKASALALAAMAVVSGSAAAGGKLDWDGTWVGVNSAGEKLEITIADDKLVAFHRGGSYLPANDMAAYSAGATLEFTYRGFTSGVVRLHRAGKGAVAVINDRGRMTARVPLQRE